MKAIIFTAFICLMMLATAKAQQTDTTKTVKDTTAVADGSSFAKAIFINEKKEFAGDAAEYTWLDKHYPGYHTKMQRLVYHDKKPYDILSVILADGTAKDFYFDISNFFGKF